MSSDFKPVAPRVGMPVRVTVNGEPFPGLVAEVHGDEVITAVYFKAGLNLGRVARTSDLHSPFAYFAYGTRLNAFSDPDHWSWP